MSKLFSRKAIIPVWIIAFGLFAVFEAPMSFATGVFLLIAALVVPAIVLLLPREHPPTVAEVLNRVEASGAK